MLRRRRWACASGRSSSGAKRSWKAPARCLSAWASKIVPCDDCCRCRRFRHQRSSTISAAATSCCWRSSSRGTMPRWTTIARKCSTGPIVSPTMSARCCWPTLTRRSAAIVQQGGLALCGIHRHSLPAIRVRQAVRPDRPCSGQTISEVLSDHGCMTRRPGGYDVDVLASVIYSHWFSHYLAASRTKRCRLRRISIACFRRSATAGPDLRRCLTGEGAAIQRSR